MTHSNFLRGPRWEIASLCKSLVHRIKTHLKCFGKSVCVIEISPPPPAVLNKSCYTTTGSVLLHSHLFFCSMQFINTLLAYIVAWNLLSTILGTRQEQGCFIRSCLFDALATCVPQFPSWLQRFNSGCTTSLYFAQAYSSVSLHWYSSLRPNRLYSKVCSLFTSVLSLYWSPVTDDSFVRVCVCVILSNRSSKLKSSGAMELRVGNKYRLGRKIGSGSFGDIYLGEYLSK